jgi:CheY-like chemotaxis protein
VPQSVLVLEDEAPVLKLIRMLLENSGREVVGVESGEQALDIAADRSAGIDLLIADVILRDQNGPEIGRRLLAVYPGMACLFISGYPEEELQNRDLLQGGTLGAAKVAFLSKPFKPSELIKAVDALIGPPVH